ncbi:DUF6090 family protein [Algoriphagus sp. SE2]|uniref:DUF6090 family protein n=1 Tax=Algoriphagus sp. SE2 TaxID=3141536 RepID=UPI0031CD01C5
MIKFFRKIRQKLLSENKFSKYLLYAIGEIALVMVGILLALQVNNWNESRKERVQEIKLYENLLVSLTADSTDVVTFSGLIRAGMEAQKFFISNSYQELVENYTIQQLEDSIKKAGQIGASFFPRYSAYNQLSNGGFHALLQSEEIKSKLLELYDRRYQRYLHIDASIDEKSEFHIKPIIKGDLQIFYDRNNIQPASVFDIKKFERFYPKLVIELSSSISTVSNALDSLQNCQEAINELLSLIRDELEHLKS